MVTFSNLPEEITIIIFCRLPVKSVGRCRCVSKSWQTLLCQPNFIRSHLNLTRSLRKESLLISDALYSLYSAPLNNAHHLLDEITIFATKLDFANHPDALTWALTSCDGLVLVGDKEKNKFVMNPITKDIREVPDIPAALRPHESFIVYGFGYDSVNDDYKIVRFSYFFSYVFLFLPEECCIPTFVRIYSLKTGIWKAVEESPMLVRSICRSTSGVYVDGCIHWVAYSIKGSNSIIMAFDLSEEKFREVATPIDCVCDHCIAVLDGYLCIFNEEKTEFWVMKEYGVAESWTKFTISISGEEQEVFRMNPLCMLGEEEVLLNRGHKFVMCNLKDGILKEVMVNSGSDRLLAETIFVESLLSPHVALNQLQ